VTAQAGEQKPWNNVAPAWSPDGSQIAFLTDRTGRWEIWVMNADGSQQRPMFTDQVDDQLDIHYNFVDERVLSWR
jgi:Tol biopolymer transport system component